eukprot:CAMPEP_0115195312 /NCGR_PEP_ID=MMETSP0270-20121206/14516_1 /TAXON_ID=71861 /ORGANISM="Scrippsiella trochoidea, Strain CCMP3099" /LENGTH=132 /DNA_ID=CAMNT_0002608631 /DNA_START=119 /DNA_END=514 /DNA_ORIENTATION=-
MTPAIVPPTLRGGGEAEVSVYEAGDFSLRWLLLLVGLVPIPPLVNQPDAKLLHWIAAVAYCPLQSIPDGHSGAAQRGDNVEKKKTAELPAGLLLGRAFGCSRLRIAAAAACCASVVRHGMGSAPRVDLARVR